LRRRGQAAYPPVAEGPHVRPPAKASGIGKLRHRYPLWTSFGGGFILEAVMDEAIEDRLTVIIAHASAFGVAR
jgi:hypothetical protein